MYFSSQIYQFHMKKKIHFVTIIKKTTGKKKETHPVTVVLSSEWEAKKLLPIYFKVFTWPKVQKGP